MAATHNISINEKPAPVHALPRGNRREPSVERRTYFSPRFMFVLYPGGARLATGEWPAQAAQHETMDQTAPLVRRRCLELPREAKRDAALGQTPEVGSGTPMRLAAAATTKAPAMKPTSERMTAGKPAAKTATG